MKKSAENHSAVFYVWGTRGWALQVEAGRCVLYFDSVDKGEIMTLTLEIAPEIERALEAKAQRAGVPVADYAVRVLAENVADNGATGQTTTAVEREDWQRLSKVGLARAYSDDEPDYPASLVRAHTTP